MGTGAAVGALLAFQTVAMAAGPGGRLRPVGRARVLRAVVGRHQVLQVSGQEGPVPHRAGQRLHRQYLAHPDDPDRQGLCGAARRRRQAQGIQGRLDRRGRAGADLGDQQLHRFRLRRHRRQRAEPDRLRAGDQARQGGRRHPGRLRQHPRHRPTPSTSTSTRRASASCGPSGWSTTCPNGGKVLEVRGVAGTSVDTDRHNGIHEVLDASGKKWDVAEVDRQVGRRRRPEGDRRRHRRQRPRSTASPPRAATPASSRR